MIAFPGCKINLGLRILNKREDGFHNLETIFYPLPIKEALEIIRINDPQNTEPLIFTSSGNTIEGNIADNLCIKAFNILKKDFPQIPAIKMHLHKTIPTGAGLGGGSADASAALKLLNTKFQLNLSTEQLMKYSLELGSDCPFFILDQPCYATGRGELLEPIALSLKGYKLVLVNPGIHINTGWAFSQLNLSEHKEHQKNLKEILQQDPGTWREELINDFEVPVFNKHPELKNIKETLYHKNAVFACMSGSGSSIAGLFKKTVETVFNFPQHYYIKELAL